MSETLRGWDKVHCDSDCPSNRALGLESLALVPFSGREVMKIIFLDVDGPLLSGRAWALAANQQCIEVLKEGGRHGIGEMARKVTFDPCAVALVNLLCTKTGAKVVVSSNWRRNVGLGETRDKLLEQGIERNHLHDNWACGFRFSSQKGDDISSWLSENRPTTEPGEARQKPRSKAERPSAAQRHSINDMGFNYFVLYDELVHPHETHTLQVDYAEGFAMSDYRVACGFLGGKDPARRVIPISEEDYAIVLSAWRGDRMAAVRWLYTERAQWSEARCLAAQPDRAREAAAYFLGYVFDPVAAAAEARAGALTRLRRDTAHLRHRRRRMSNDF